MIFSEIHWSAQVGIPILTLLQLLPLLAAALMVILRKSDYLLLAALVSAGIEMLLGLELARHYDHDSGAMQFAERLDIFGLLNYHAAVDGISILFILLTALITILVMVYGPVRRLGSTWQFLAIVFLVEACLMGLFTTMNLLGFALLSLLQLGLVGYILWRWATSPEKDIALTRFYQFMGTGVALLITGTLILGWDHAYFTGSGWSFDLFDLAAAPVSAHFQTLVFFLLFYGMAVRTPLFPLHGWLPLIAHHGNIAIAPTLLLGLKIGIYGILRFIFPILPDAVVEWHQYVVAFAVVGVFYAALLAMSQTNLRRLLAYAVVSHTGLVVIGLFSLHPVALQGSVMLSATFGLAATALFFMTGLVYHRTRTTNLSRLGGLFDQIPFIGITFFIAGLSIIGMPGTPGFDAVHLVLEAAILHFGGLLTIAAALGNVVAAGFLLWAFQRAFLAPLPAHVRPMEISPTNRSERLVAGLVILVLLGVGFYSEPWLVLIEKPLHLLGSVFPQ
jgi:NADH-quinone oxidoreductase subunit M